MGLKIPETTAMGERIDLARTQLLVKEGVTRGRMLRRRAGSATAASGA